MNDIITSMVKKRACVAVYSNWPAKSQTEIFPFARLKDSQSTPTVLSMYLMLGFFENN